MNCFYGKYDVYSSLLNDLYKTKDSFIARLTLINLVEEAHGLDSFPKFIKKFQGANDHISANFFKIISEDETNHLRIGFKYFHFCIKHNLIDIDELKDVIDPIDLFHQIVKKYHDTGELRPPFNHQLRQQIGLTRAYYVPLVAEKYKIYLTFFYLGIFFLKL